MTPEECQHADWQAIGYRDGQSGFSSERLTTYVQECNDAGFNVDRAAWQHGQTLGLSLYCSPDNGYRVGLRGETYNGVCPNTQFVKQYNLGYQAYQVKTRLSEIETELQRIDWQLDTIDSKEKEKRQRLKESRSRLISERNRLIRPQYSVSFEF